MRIARLAPLALLAGCGAEPEPAAPQPSPTSAAIPPAPVVTETATAPAVTLFADGIILDRAETAQLRFGQSRAAVEGAVGGALGEAEITSNAECGAGPMEFAAYGDLTLNFLDGAFVGWIADGAADAVTVDGLALGNTLGAIKRERSAALVSESTLEGEFEYASGDGGTIGGFLQGEGEAAKVTALYAGVNCFFR